MSKPPPPHGPLITVAEYALCAGVSEQTARRRLRAGELRGRRTGAGRGHWRVFSSEVIEPGGKDLPPEDLLPLTLRLARLAEGLDEDEGGAS